jgi:phosphate transport system ATP-binding protein
MMSNAFTLAQVEQGHVCCQAAAHMTIRQLSVAYHDRVVLEDVSLDIHAGCITALIGPSGCGKSSFLACLNRLTDMIPGARVKGEILVEGFDVLDPKLDVNALRLNVGMIFQKPNPFPLSIRRNLELPMLERGIRKKAELDERLQEVLRDVGLWDEVKDRLNGPAMSLSGGQQQRLCIARALTIRPKILLMDEPCSALDPISSAVVEEMIKRLSGRYTIVIATHNLAQARRIANYAAFFWVKNRVGTLVEFGECIPLFETPRERLTAAYVSGLSG